MNESVFHIIYIVTNLSFFAIRIVSIRWARRSSENIEYKESGLNMALRGTGALLYVSTMISYMLYPRWLAWAVIALPAWARWTGAILALITIAGLGWVQWALGKNFDGTLHIREGHELVTHGPYHWVRHPMYTVFVSYGIALLLLTANWFIGAPFLVGLAVVLYSRVGREEATMIEQFGDDYRAYMRRTGRFLPKRLGAS